MKTKYRPGTPEYWEAMESVRRSFLNAIYTVYDELYKINTDKKEDPEVEKMLNVFCCRLAFCLYIDASEIYGKTHPFIRILEDATPESIMTDLKDYQDKLKALTPGGLFDLDYGEPKINQQAIDNMVTIAKDLDWSELDAMGFSIIYENLLGRAEKKRYGMSYTAEENIHKVIDPLFLDDLKQELEDVKNTEDKDEQTEKAKALQEKLSRHRFLDPACGSGNFLFEIYLCLRTMENDLIKIIYDNTEKERTFKKAIELAKAVNLSDEFAEVLNQYD